jgi:hypothetical protein
MKEHNMPHGFPTFVEIRVREFAANLLDYLDVF